MNGILEKLRDPEVLKLLQPAGVGALLGGGGLGLLDYLRSDEDEDQGSRVRSALSSGLLGASLGGLAGAGYGAMGAMQQPPGAGPSEDNAYTVARGMSQGNPKATGAVTGAATGGLLAGLRARENGLKLPESRPNFQYAIDDLLAGGKDPTGGVKKWTETVNQIVGAKPSGGLTIGQLSALKDMSIPENLSNGGLNKQVSNSAGVSIPLKSQFDAMLPDHTASSQRSTGNMFGRAFEGAVHDPLKMLAGYLDKKVPGNPTGAVGGAARKGVEHLKRILPNLRPQTAKEYLASGGDMSGFRNKIMSGRMSPLAGLLGGYAAGYGGTKLLDNTELGLAFDRNMAGQNFYDRIVKDPKNIQLAEQAVAGMKGNR